jgi:cytochrome c2
VASDAQSITPTDRAWDWAPGEEMQDPGGSELTGEPYRGFQVYLAQGCTYCHTLYVRPADVVTGWGEGFTKEEDVSEVGDFVNYPYTLLGTQRTGPDLTLIGRRIPDMGYQIDHLKQPRKFKPNSIMPNYDYLSDRDLRDLAAYLVSLGNIPAELKAGVLEQPVETGLDDVALAGQDLFRSQGCVGCHSVDGSPNAGPTWLGLYGKTEELADGTTIVVDDAFLTESIVEPGATLIRGFNNFMPAYAQLTQDELAALVAYIKSLSEVE